MRLLLAALLVWSAAAAPPLCKAEALPPHSTELSLTQGESRTVPIFGVTAAWTIDPSVADAAVHNGSVTVSARAPGRTKLIVSGVTGEQTYDVAVAQRPGAQAAAPQRRGDRATAEVRYTSAAREVQSSVQVTREDAKRRTEATVRTIHQTAAPRGERAQTSIAGASYRVFTRGRELTLFDRDVDHSPLTLAATPLRGVHYLDDRWRLHAGYTAYATYRSFLVPVERQLVAGGGYAVRTSARSTVTPSFFAIRDEGSVASLLYDYAEGDRFLARAEVGYSRGFGVAGLVDYDGDRDRVRASLRYRPDEFAVAGSASPRGFFGDASWTRAYGSGSTASAAWSATDAAGARVMSAGADVDHRVWDGLSLTGGASWAAFDGRRTTTIPLGVRADLGRYGITALYRYTAAHDDADNRGGGHGGRIGLRASFGRFHASAFADHQRNAPTLSAIFAERPDLALALEELGITATSPADVARALREHAILAELGFIDGVTLDLAPARTQFGFEAAYLGAGAARHQLRLRVLRSVTESVAARRTSTIATLSYARRIAASADVFASWTYWRTDTANAGARTQPFAEVGIRRTFDGLPSLLGGTGTIAGIVFADEDLDGRSDGTGVDAEVQLDGQKTQRTRPDGTFAFTGVPRGTHRVTARVPDRAEAYFTTPARVEAEPGQRVEFGVAATPARLFGRVTNDGGAGIEGVRVQLVRGTKRLDQVTASDGSFAFTSAPGEWELSLVVDSIPPGHDLRVPPRTLMLDRAEPAQASFVVRKHAGRASARPPVVVAVAHETAPKSGVHLQIGAYRVHANAVAAAERARAAGVTVTLHPSGALMLVRTAPIETQEAAQAVAARLKHAGLDAVVVSRN